MADVPAVLITGATSGLGRYLAGELAGSGWQVLAHGRDAGRVADLCTGLGHATRGYVADLASLAEVRDLAAAVRAEVPRLDVLVNNAAVGFGAPGGPRQLSADGHELRFAVNYLAPVLLTRLLVPLVTASAPSRIVNVGSIGQVPFAPADAGFEQGYDGVTAYRRSKLALAAFTFDLAAELAPAGVTVNCLHPASLMGTAMVKLAGITPLSTVEEGGEATMRLITDPALDTVTGQFFDGLKAARARPEAHDPQFRASLRAVTGELLSYLQIRRTVLVRGAEHDRRAGGDAAHGAYLLQQILERGRRSDPQFENVILIARDAVTSLDCG